MDTIEQQKIIKKLSKYGAVRTCKNVHPEIVTIILTDGFSEKNTMNVLGLITESFPDYPILETCIMETNFCCVILKTKPNE
jgi:hypothetical protein